MFHTKFVLEVNRKEDKLSLESELSHSYTRICHELFGKHYKLFGEEDECKDEVRVTVPKDVAEDTWHMICDLFEEKSWKVNFIKLN